MVDRPNRSRTRRMLRPFIWVLAAGVSLIGLAAVVLYLSVDPSERGSLSGSNDLWIPPLAESSLEDGVRVFELEAREGATAFADVGISTTWGFNGSCLGPTLKATR